MNQQQRDAMRARLDEIIAAAGPDGIGFRGIYDRITKEFVATRRNVQDQLTVLENGGLIRAGGVSQNVRTYIHGMYRREMTQRERDRAEIHAPRPLKTVFAGQKPARFDVR